MLLAILLAVACICGRPAQAAKQKFRGYKVYNVVPHDEDALRALRELLNDDPTIDAWQFPSKVKAKAVLMVSPTGLQSFHGFLKNAKIYRSLYMNDVDEHLAKEKTSKERGRTHWLDSDSEQSLTNSDYFRNLSDINTFLNDTLNQCSPALLCELYSIGYSYEKRPIKVFKISKASGAGRKAFWIDGTIHAREWISTATVLKILSYLATRADENAVRLTDAYDWYILPVMNPDGYEYTWTTNRLWRKNRRPYRGSNCIGTDLNRNFDYRWGADGASTNPCSTTFCGSSAASEPETMAVQNELIRIGSTLTVMLTVHAYGNMWMFPWGNTITTGNATICQRASDHDDMMTVATAAALAAQGTQNTAWTWGNSCETIYPTTGGTDDFSKGVAGVKYAFCVEARGDSFISSVEDIDLSFTEVWNAIVAMCDAVNAVNRGNLEALDDEEVAMI